MTLGTVMPTLRFFDQANTKEFYLIFLGFQLDWEHRFERGLPLYMQISCGECVLHLSEHYGDAAPGAAMRIQCADIEALHRELNGAQYKYARPGIEDTPWGSRDLSVRDPSSNRLTFHPKVP